MGRGKRTSLLKNKLIKILRVPRESGLAAQERMKLRETDLVQEVMDILLTELSTNDNGDLGGFQVPKAEKTIALFPGAFRPPTKGHLRYSPEFDESIRSYL